MGRLGSRYRHKVTYSRDVDPDNADILDSEEARIRAQRTGTPVMYRALNSPGMPLVTSFPREREEPSLFPRVRHYAETPLGDAGGDLGPIGKALNDAI